MTVRLYNPTIDAYWDSPDESVTHWTSLGWEVADDAHVPAPPYNAPKDEWVAHAESLGIDTSGMSKAAIQAAVEEVSPPGDEDVSPLGGTA